MPSLPKTYKAILAESAGAPLKIVTRDLKLPEPGHILVKVLACGVCFSDHGLAQGEFGPQSLPRIPGHELIGDVVAVGDGVTKFTVGQRVGGPWHGGHDNECRSCQKGIYQTCQNAQVNGVSRDGGYAEYVDLRAEAVVRVPSDLDPAETAPLLCAGVTVFNGIRKMQIEHGGLVAVVGVGGLGHLAVQYASRMGYRVVVLSSGSSKKDFAMKLGAHEYVDTSTVDAVEALQKLGGAALIVATAPNPKVISPLTGGLQAGGKLLVLAPVGNVEFNTLELVLGGRSVHGWPSGHAMDSEDAIAFARTHGVKCMVERFPMDDVQKATDHMTSGKVRFRSVLVME